MSKERPVIAITSSMSDSYIRMKQTYFNAVFGAGGIPVFLPFTGGAESARRIFNSGAFDGVLFAGGADVHPKNYGEEITGQDVECVEERDEFELEMARLVKDTDLPIFGICRGIQLMNVAFGGTLHQHVPGHRQEESGTTHERPVSLTEGTLLRELMGSDKIGINSFHHQAVKDVAPGFIVAARSDRDGTIESIEPAVRSERFILGVQWHPEIYYSYSRESAILFETFVNNARGKR